MNNFDKFLLFKQKLIVMVTLKVQIIHQAFILCHIIR